MGDPAHGRPRQRLADERQLARARLREPVSHREDGAVVLGDAPAAVGEPLGLGQVAVLVEDPGQGSDLVVEGEVGGAGERPGHPPLAPLLEELVHLGRPGAAEVAEELGRQVAVALRVERLGGRRQLVDVAGPPAAGALGHLVAVGEQPVLLEAGQLEPDGGGGERERLRDGGDVERAPALEEVEDGAAGRRQLVEGGLRRDGSGGILLGRHPGGGHGRMRWTSPNSCQRYPSSSAAA